MSYKEDYYTLRQVFNNESSVFYYQNFDIINIPFCSSNDFSSSLKDFVQSSNSYSNKLIKEISNEDSNYKDDIKIEENNNFNYFLFKKKLTGKSKNVIILLHGLNEKQWDKYLPWAKALLEKTGKDVILFPISFHMNRAPSSWGNSRLMNKLSEFRNRTNPSNKSSSFVNASISNRLQLKPARFLWSGIKTINDIIQLLNQIFEGKHPLVSQDAKIDFFGYSIGAFLSEILFMANPNNMLNNSRLFIFCGGSTFNKINPVSRFIIDHTANYILRSYYVNEFESQIKSNEGLKNYFIKFNSFAIHFKSMLDYNKMKSYREKRLRLVSSKITALALKKDVVFPPENVYDTLTGDKHDIPVKVKSMDFPYDYDHVNPFPLNEKIEHLVEEAFSEVFDFASKELSS